MFSTTTARLERAAICRVPVLEKKRRLCSIIAIADDDGSRRHMGSLETVVPIRSKCVLPRNAYSSP